MKTFCLLLLALIPSVLSAQPLDNSALSGKYYFVHLLVSVAPSGVTENARNLGGSMTFDGGGGYTFQGSLGSGEAAPSAAGGAGTYAVSSNAFVSLDNPIDGSLTINGRLGAGAEILLGASTEATNDSYDLFVAVKAPAGGVTNATLNGEYTGGTLLFPDGAQAALTTALLSFSPRGDGAFALVSAAGHAADQGETNFEETLLNATYALNADGSGTASFGSSGALFSGDRDIFVSANGNYLIGYSTEAGGREIFLALKDFSSQANDASWDGNFWMTEIFIDPTETSFSTAAGALRADGAGTAALSQRLSVDLARLDFSGINFYGINTDSTGLLSIIPGPGPTNMAIGAPAAGSPSAFVGAHVESLGQQSRVHGLFFGVRMPEFSGTGVFLNPLGVLNSASFAPPTFPISGGTILSLFGTGMAPPDTSQQTSTVPWPASLAGVSVTVNGVLAPLRLVSPTLIQIAVPFATSGPLARIVVNNNGTLSNEVEVPVAATSPGVFSLSQNGLGPGVIVHSSDFRLVTDDDPAIPGEFVSILLTGLGGLNPPIADGAAGQTDPLSFATDPGIQVLFGFEGEAGEVTFAGAMPGFPGVYQINVRVPDLLIIGSGIPVTLLTSNACSDFVDIAIGF